MALSKPPSGSKKEFLLRMKDARIGDPVAQYDVALMYANGVGVAKDVEQAFAWTRSAAEKGHAQAQYLLGRAHHQGLGTPVDLRLAMAWYQRAAEHGSDKAVWNLAKLLAQAQPQAAFAYALEAARKGHIDAEFAVGEHYRKGDVVQQDLMEAHRWTLAAAKKGSARAQYAMGCALELRKSRGKDAQTAMDWYRLAAAQGMPAAQLALQRLDQGGQGRDASASTAKARTSGKERRLADVRWVKFAAKGNADDFMQLGCLFEQGIAVEKSLKQARLWYQKAAELGQVEAMVLLARSYQDSAPEQAERWYRQAAEAGHAEAQFAMATCQQSDPAAAPLEAFHGYARAAAQGHARAQHALAEQLHSATDRLQRALLQAAAEAGVAQAQWALGEAYAHGDGVEQDWFLACKYYQQAADQGHAEALCALGICLSEGFGVKRDMARAFTCFEQAAAQGDPRAQWKLGALYAAGLPGVPADTKQATLLCKRAAQAGYAPAQATFGTLFAQAQKYERAALWWEKAALQGDLEAQYNLANACLKGQGVATDAARGWELMRAAAEAGLAPAQARLGMAYATGEGLVQDLIESAKWFILASDQGDKAALSNRKRAQTLLSAAQFTEATRRALAVELRHA
jgi:TPR repeat protein